jgi:cation transport ATPase
MQGLQAKVVSMEQVRADHLKTAVLLSAVIGLTAGLAASVAGREELAGLLWFAGVVPALAALVAEILRSVARGEVGLDLVAALSMSAALAFGETLAAAVVAVMYAGGTFLESFAEGRARREMHDLLARVPRTATRHRNGGLEEVALDRDRTRRPAAHPAGRRVPVDGSVASAEAFLDTSALTGESLPVRLQRGAEAMSGSTNGRGLRPDGDPSREGQHLCRDRAARRGGAALEGADVAAGRPLVARLSRRHARHCRGGVVVRGRSDPGRRGAGRRDPLSADPRGSGGARRRALARGAFRRADQGRGAARDDGAHPDADPRQDRHAHGRAAAIVAIDSREGMAADELLRLAAALDQASQHPVAQALVAAAQARGLALPVPEERAEVPGEGVMGLVAGRRGDRRRRGFVAARVGAGAPSPAMAAGSARHGRRGRRAHGGPSRDGRSAARGRGRDRSRPAARGIGRILLATGDRAEVAERVTEGLGLDGVRAGLTPDRKVLLVLSERKNGPVMMVGDGVNDAPALAAADVGVAMGARGAAASAEAADAVLLVDRLDRLGAGMEIARAARRIALQSVVAGIGLSVAGMIAAAFGGPSHDRSSGRARSSGGCAATSTCAVILNALRKKRLQRHVG